MSALAIQIREGIMLNLRTIQLLAVGFCLLLAVCYTRLVVHTVTSIDRLFRRRSFDVSRLANGIREQVESPGIDPASGCPTRKVLFPGLYLWLCRKLLHAVGSEPRRN